jgi:hypothetical protein
MTSWPAVSALAFLASCVPSLDAVRTTAKLGSELATYQDAFDVAITFCHVADASPTPDPNCAKLDADRRNWHAVNDVLVGYAAALTAMADDSKDKSEKDDIATALAAVAKVEPAWSDALSSNVTSGVSSSSAALISGIVGVYRRERLGQTIRDSNTAVQRLAHAIDANIAVLDAAEQNALGQLDGTRTSIDAEPDLPRAEKLGHSQTLVSVAATIVAHRVVLGRYKQAVDAFAKAHADVFDHLSGLGDRKADLEILKLIASDLVTIAGGVKTAATPVPKT